MNPEKWHPRFLRLAKEISSWSLDPSTKCGSVIVDKKKRIVSVGFNGFPPGIKDEENLYKSRPDKYLRVSHSEANSLSFAERPIDGCSIFIYPFLSCSTCTKLIITRGIVEVITLKMSDDLELRWGDDIKVSRELFSEVGIKVIEYSKDILNDHSNHQT